MIRNVVFILNRCVKYKNYEIGLDFFCSYSLKFVKDFELFIFCSERFTSVQRIIIQKNKGYERFTTLPCDELSIIFNTT